MDKPKKFPEPQPYCNEKRPPIDLHAVESSQIKAIGYDAETRTLAVKFNFGAGAIYHYPDVAPETHEAFVNAESIGQFFGKHIKALPFKKYHAEQVPA
jgi:KTSC domain